MGEVVRRGEITNRGISLVNGLASCVIGRLCGRVQSLERGVTCRGEVQPSKWVWGVKGE